MGCSKRLREFGKALSERLRSSAAYSVLPADLSTWTEGGCSILASALKMFIGPSASLWGLFYKEDGVISHVVCRVGDCYLDADGAWTKDELFAQRGGPRYVILKRYDPDNDTESSISCPKSAVLDLVELLIEWFHR